MRPGLNKGGQQIAIKLNTFNVLELPTAKIMQWDVAVSGRGSDKSGLVKKVFASKAVQSHLSTDWIFDGNKLAW